MGAWMKRHPVMTGLVVLSAVVGGVLGVWFGSEEWSVARRLGAGVLSGLGVALIILFNRMLGAYVEPEEGRRRRPPSPAVSDETSRSTETSGAETSERTANESTEEEE